MNKLFNVLMLALLLVAAGCSKNISADIEDIFRTVPSTASCVAVADLESIIRKSGSEVKDGKLLVAPGIKAAIGRTNPKASALLAEKNGIDPTVAVVFTDGVTTYLTGLLSNSDDFKAFAEKNAGEKFTDQQGVNVCGAFAYKDSRFWLVLGGRSRVDASTILEYLSLSDSQSFLSKKEFVSRLVKDEDDIRGWADISALMNMSQGSFEQRALAKVGLQTVFSDAEYVYFDIEFKKGEMELDAEILNSKGKAAKYNLPVQKINEDVIGRLQGNADGLVAVAIPAKLIQQLKKSTEGAPSVLGIYLMALNCVDGTAAVAIGPDSQFDGIITTNGQSTSDLMSLMKGMVADTKLDGKYILFGSREAGKGAVSIARMGEALKGAVAGAVVTKGDVPQIEMTAVRLEPESGSLHLQIEVKTRNADKNFLEAIAD